MAAPTAPTKAQLRGKMVDSVIDKKVRALHCKWQQQTGIFWSGVKSKRLMLEQSLLNSVNKIDADATLVTEFKAETAHLLAGFNNSAYTVSKASEVYGDFFKAIVQKIMLDTTRKVLRPGGSKKEQNIDESVAAIFQDRVDALALTCCMAILNAQMAAFETNTFKIPAKPAKP